MTSNNHNQSLVRRCYFRICLIQWKPLKNRDGECMTPVEKVIAQIVKLCEEYHVKKAILFGSRAIGTALERSDIDIAVSGVPD